MNINGDKIRRNRRVSSARSGQVFLFPIGYAVKSIPNGCLSPGERVAKGRERGRVVAGKDKAELRSNQAERSRARATLPEAIL